MILTKREKELLLNVVSTSILYMGWNIRIKDIYDSKGNKDTGSCILIPIWIEEDDEEFGKKELRLIIKSPWEYVLQNRLDEEDEKVYGSVMSLLDAIKGYYNLED